VITNQALLVIPNKKFPLNRLAVSIAFLVMQVFSASQAFASPENTLYENEIITALEHNTIKSEAEQTRETHNHQLPISMKQPASPNTSELLNQVEWSPGNGMSFGSKNGNYLTNIRFRLQSRFSTPFDSDPRTIEGFDAQNSTSFNLRRARIKVGGHGYKPWIGYYFEYDWTSSSLLDWRISLGKYEWFKVRIGQWKINYNRERVDSSGKQQFVERSIVNREFTVDRQKGVMAYGRLFSGTLTDLSYYAGAFTGTGRGTQLNDDTDLMYMGRLQWNFLGRELKFSQSDVEFHEKPSGSLAFGYATVNNNCTRFSSEGCGNLDGFISSNDTEAGQFRINQMVEEFAFKWRGYSIQHEFHWKQIKDSVEGLQTNLRGSYTQAGFFPHSLINEIPKQLELAGRYAFVDPNTSVKHVGIDKREEVSAAINWFFSGHNNKVTLGISHLTIAELHAKNRNDERVQLQWDISF